MKSRCIDCGATWGDAGPCAECAPDERARWSQSSPPRSSFRRSKPKPKPKPTDQYQANSEKRCRMAGGLCELRLSGRCDGVGNQAHHVYPKRLAIREHGLRDDSVENLRHSCGPCNMRVESIGRKSAEKLGLFSSSPLDPNWPETLAAHEARLARLGR